MILLISNKSLVIIRIHLYFEDLKFQDTFIFIYIYLYLFIFSNSILYIFKYLQYYIYYTPHLIFLLQLEPELEPLTLLIVSSSAVSFDVFEALASSSNFLCNHGSSATSPFLTSSDTV